MASRFCSAIACLNRAGAGVLCPTADIPNSVSTAATKCFISQAVALFSVSSFRARGTRLSANRKCALSSALFMRVEVPLALK